MENNKIRIPNTEFHIGDRVKNDTRGEGFIIACCKEIHPNILVEYDNWNGGHAGRMTELIQGRHGEEGKNNCYYMENYEITLIEPSIPLSRYNIGDVVNTNDRGYVYTSMDEYANERYYTWEKIVGCNCNSTKETNIKILRKVYSAHMGKWWYECSDFDNWLEEGCIDGLFSPEQKGELTKGEYYTCIIPPHNIFLSSGKNLISKCIMGHRNEYWSKEIDWANGKLGKDYRIATQEEKDWLDKCIELDKYISQKEFLKQKKNKPINSLYVVGDIVVCIGDDNNSPMGKSYGWEKDSCIKINNFTTSAIPNDIIWNGINGGGIYIDKVRMATKEEKEFYEKKGGNYYITEIPEKKYIRGLDPYDFTPHEVCVSSFAMDKVFDKEMLLKRKKELEKRRYVGVEHQIPILINKKNNKQKLITI